MNIPVFDKEKKEYLDFLYERIRKAIVQSFGIAVTAHTMIRKIRQENVQNSRTNRTTAY